MSGTQSSGRPGGNPDLVKYQYTTERDEPLTEKLQLRITKSMLEQLKLLENKNEFVREAIAQRLRRRKKK